MSEEVFILNQFFLILNFSFKLIKFIFFIKNQKIFISKIRHICFFLFSTGTGKLFK
jgi:hypothetical protein